MANLRYEGEIVATSSSDRRNCWLTGMALLPDDHLLVTDFYPPNHAVKLLDYRTGDMVTQVTLDGFPWDVCLVAPNRAAVTVPVHMQIQFVGISGDKLALQKAFNVGGECKGIDYHDGRLFVCYGKEEKIEVLTLDGRIINRVDRNTAGILDYPSYLTVSFDKNIPYLYVSDSVRNLIVKFSLNLEIMQKYQSFNLQKPRGLTPVSNGQLMVCGEDSHNVVLLDTGTGAMTEVLGPGDDIRSAQCVCYSPTLRKLFVTCYTFDHTRLNKTVKVFTAEM
ncbi:uncharacterized protein LOC128217754 [Mya arenaria]|uniref:uncharacterized protein LOC128217754 n=1 Tax=Mya arenaria TaxID=6604 RepID=UPI0022E67883|nr:uncharacterized protein LOC128217754 [Mya arenaria]